ncbi:coatomer subunit delta, partial [Linderina macrospora]
VPAMVAAAAAPAVPAVDMKGVHVQVEEHITAIVNRDGGLEQMEVKGDLSLVVNDEAYTNVQVGVMSNDTHNAQVKTHPKIDKKKFHAESVIALRDANGSFPLGQPIGVLKWRIVSGDEDAVPFTINCWPTPNGNGSIDVNIEYELTNERLVLDDVVVSIPIPHGAQPTVGEVDGLYSVNHARSTLDWQIPTVDASNKDGSLDFSVAGDDAGAFFPVMISFACSKSYYDLDVTGISTPDGQQVDYSESVALVPVQYGVI